MCNTKLCLCFDFLWQTGHSNFGSTPHSNRLCRLRLCGRAYELPHRSQLNAPPAVTGVGSIDEMLVEAPPPAPEAVAGDMSSVLNDTLLPPLEYGVAAVPVANVTMGGVNGAAAAVTECVVDWCCCSLSCCWAYSRKHVAGVSRRKSHG